MGDKLTDYFQEEARLKARRSDTLQSPHDYWKIGDNVVKIFDTAAKIGKNGIIDAFSLREAMYQLAKEATQFKITLVVSVIRFFHATRVLDFSAGWGDRLIGAIAAGVERYVGVDPNIDLKPGHDRIIETFAPTMKDKYTIIYSPFQTASLPPNQLYDLIFTSPPFFDFEVYSQNQGQSILQFPKLDDWLIYFLFVSLRKAWSYLVVGGHMVIHISDVYKTHVTEAMNLLIQSKLMGSTYLGLIASYGGADRPRPMWVWRKDKFSQEWSLRSDQAEKDLSQFFGSIYRKFQ